jgi:hypothetical protein
MFRNLEMMNAYVRFDDNDEKFLQHHLLWVEYSVEQ